MKLLKSSTVNEKEKKERSQTSCRIGKAKEERINWKVTPISSSIIAQKKISVKNGRISGILDLDPQQHSQRLLRTVRMVKIPQKKRESSKLKTLVKKHTVALNNNCCSMFNRKLNSNVWKTTVVTNLLSIEHLQRVFDYYSENACSLS